MSSNCRENLLKIVLRDGVVLETKVNKNQASLLGNIEMGNDNYVSSLDRFGVCYVKQAKSLCNTVLLL